MPPIPGPLTAPAAGLGGRFSGPGDSSPGGPRQIAIAGTAAEAGGPVTPATGPSPRTHPARGAHWRRPDPVSSSGGVAGWPRSPCMGRRGAPTASGPRSSSPSTGCRSGGAMLVGVGQGGFIGSLADTQMHQLAQTAAQAVADLAQGIGMAQLAEQHGDELGPAIKPLGGALGLVLLHQTPRTPSGESDATVD